MGKPLCYTCVHRLGVVGDCHSRCNNFGANVEGYPHGIEKGWFLWPVNFDPVWLMSCSGFSSNLDDKMQTNELPPLIELLCMLK